MTNSTQQTVLKGHSLFCPGIKPEVLIEKNTKNSGIVFTEASGDINLSLESLHANQSASGARYLYVRDKEDNKVVRVPEHLLSAIFWKKISDLKISTNKNQVPLNGPGIQSFFNDLEPFANTEKTTNTHFSVVKKGSYEMEANGIFTKIQAEPHERDSLRIEVTSGRHPDLPNLEEKPFILEDAYQEAHNHLTARAIARLQDRKKYYAWVALSAIGFGINNETYLIAKPQDDAATIRRNMQKQYQTNGNEHLAHTAVCDFPGELLAVADKISGSFTLRNTNHISRLAAIRSFIKTGVLKEVSK